MCTDNSTTKAHKNKHVFTSPPTHTLTNTQCLNQALCNSMWSQWKILWNLYFPESTWRNLSFQFNWEQQWFPNVAPWLHQNHLEELTYSYNTYTDCLAPAPERQKLCNLKRILKSVFYKLSPAIQSTRKRLAELM